MEFQQPKSRNQVEQIRLKKSNDLIPTSSSKTTTEIVQVKEDKPKEVQNNEQNEEHFAATASPGKGYISDIKPGDFYDEEFHE